MTIPRITLPGRYAFGDNYVTQDLRLSRTFPIGERWRLTVLGEVFNLFNVANLAGHSGNLRATANFGQPTNRVLRVFGLRRHATRWVAVVVGRAQAGVPAGQGTMRYPTPAPTLGTLHPPGW